MNNKKLSRIASFIEGLPIDESLADCQTTLLATDMGVMGAGTNYGDCTNEQYTQCHKSKNMGSCQNYNNTCSDTTNGASCRNTPEKPTPIQPPIQANSALSC